MKIPLPQVGLSANTSPMIGAGVQPQVAGDVAGSQVFRLGQAALQAGSAAMGIASELRLEHDTTVAKEAYTQFSDYATEILENPRDGYFSKEGKSAVGQERAKALDSIKKQQLEIEQRLSTPVAKGMFRQQAEKAYGMVKQKVYGHEATQRRVWLLGQTRAMQSQAKRDAINSGVLGDTPPEVVDGAELAGADEDRAAGIQNTATTIGGTGKNVPPGAPQAPAGGTGGGFGGEAQEPGSFLGLTYEQAVAQERARKERRPTWQIHMDTAVEQVEEESRLLGESNELRRERVLQVRSEIHEGIILIMLDQGRTKEARAFYEKAGAKDISPLARSKIDRALKHADRADNSLNLANEIVDLLATTDEVEVGGYNLPKPITWEEELRRQAQPGGTGGGLAKKGDIDTATMLARGSAELRRRFEAGEIDAETRDMVMARLREQHGILVGQWNAEAADHLRKAEKFFDDNSGVTIDSPLFPHQLKSKLVEFGVADQARRAGALRNQRVTDPAIYRQMLQDVDNGLFEGMTNDQLFVRYYYGLGPTEWNEAQSELAVANKVVAYKPPPDDQFHDVRVQVLEAASAGRIITGKNENGVPRPDGEEEADLLQQFNAELQRRINVSQAVEKRELRTEEKVQIAKEIAGERQFAPRYDFGIDELDSDEWYWAWQRGIPEEDQAELSVITEFGTSQVVAEIPGDFWAEATDDYRLSVLPPSQQAIVEQKLTELGSGVYQREGGRLVSKRRGDEIQRMWQSYGLSLTRPSTPWIATEWQRALQIKDSVWAQLKAGK